MKLTNFAKQTIKSMRKIVLSDPKLRSLIFEMIKNQNSSMRLREINKRNGTEVPPIIIFSVTNNCNLACKGCYNKKQRGNQSKELSDSDMTRIINESQALGVSVILIAGGEPFARKNLLYVLSHFPKLTFFIFTNSLLISDLDLQLLKSFPNIIPIISMEGNQEETDERRGDGVYNKAMQRIEALNNKNIKYGISLTITTKNIQTTTSEEFILNLINKKCKVFFYSEYISLNENLDFVLDKKHSDFLFNKINSFRETYPAVFFTTRDEDQFGGCLAAGKGFVHINPQGLLEPCPMTPFSDSDLREMPLKEALQSEFFKKIRAKKLSLLKNTESGCSLWDERNWVKSILGK